MVDTYSCIHVYINTIITIYCICYGNVYMYCTPVMYRCSGYTWSCIDCNSIYLNNNYNLTILIITLHYIAVN